MSKHKLYYLCQVVGWSTYIMLAGVLNLITLRSLSLNMIIGLYTALVVGLLTSHLYRLMIVRLNWVALGIGKLIPRVIGASVFFAILFHFLYTLLLYLLVGNNLELRWNDPNLITWIMLFFVWSLIYFVVHFFQNYRKEEIKNLEWEASTNEFELKRLKSQMNPHFIFNAMNTIRALVDENPDQAKKAITQLSNVLRNSLLLGKNREISFDEELSLVKDYLEIEKTRYEERLSVKWDIDPDSGRFMIPPLMIQTLVENSIKHGISKLTDGGLVEISSQVKEDHLLIKIRNTGQFQKKGSLSEGFGLINTKKRLQLHYGNKSNLNIYNLNDKEVMTEVLIPNQSITS